MIGIPEFISILTAGGGIAGFAYQKHSKRIEKIEEELDTKVTEKDVQDKLAPLSVKLDLIYDSVKDLREDIKTLRGRSK